MITVHHLNNSRSQRILWLLEEIGVEYTLKRYERDTKTSLAPAALRAVHPLGKSPVITDGDITVAESGAIVEYLIERHADGRLMPASGTPEHLSYRYWLHYAEGSAMLPLLLTLIFGRIRTAPAPFFVRPVIKALVQKVSADFIQPQLQLHFDYVDAYLGEHEWFAGSELSGADIQMSFPLEAAVVRGGRTGAWPNIRAYVDRIQARPAYQAAVEKGGEYQIMS